MALNDPILDILEVIRNEKTYRERLEEIRSAEQVLVQTKQINMTLEQAKRQLDEAKKDRELYKDKLANAFAEINKEREKKLKDVLAKEEALRITKEAVAIQSKEAAVLKDALAKEKQQLQQEWAKLREFREVTDAKHTEARILRDDFRSRALKIREIIDYGIKE